MNLLAALACGVLFGFGLALSGMTDIAIVTGFFDVFGEWDPSLAFVMGGGLLVSLPFFQFGLSHLRVPVLADLFRVPTRKDIDARLLIGASLFGIGWGLVGLCPGPAITSLASLNLDMLWFVIAMIAGMFVADWLDQRFDSVRAGPSADAHSPRT